MKKPNKKGGFTLIEILVVIGIIAILAAVVLIAINPARQFAQARDSQRVSNVNAILNAIGQKLADSKGVFETGCPAISTTTVAEITVGVATTSGQINLGCLAPTYLPSFPFDPKTGSASSTKYFVVQDTSGRITVSATGEITTPISVTR